MRKAPRLNDAGKIILHPYQLKDPSYGFTSTDGVICVAWEKYRTEYADENGFDIRNHEPNGHYMIRMILPVNTVLIRYGRETGFYTAPEGTPYEKLSLPYIRESMEYHKYRVCKPGTHVYCIVRKGKVAPMFDSAGGAIQYMHEKSIRELRREKALEEIPYERV